MHCEMYLFFYHYFNTKDYIFHKNLSTLFMIVEQGFLNCSLLHSCGAERSKELVSNTKMIHVHDLSVL